MKVCIRPHCAIRSHKHNDVTFADFLELDEYYRKISHSLKNDKNIENYKILSDNLSKYNSRACFHILKNMLACVAYEQNLDLKKLKALYMFSMCRTIYFIKFINTQKPILREAIYGAYNRVLKQVEDDKLFVSEMEKIVPIGMLSM